MTEPPKEEMSMVEAFGGLCSLIALLISPALWGLGQIDWKGFLGLVVSGSLTLWIIFQVDQSRQKGGK